MANWTSIERTAALAATQKRHLVKNNHMFELERRHEKKSWTWQKRVENGDGKMADLRANTHLVESEKSYYHYKR